MKMECPPSPTTLTAFAVYNSGHTARSYSPKSLAPLGTSYVRKTLCTIQLNWRNNDGKQN